MIQLIVRRLLSLSVYNNHNIFKKKSQCLKIKSLDGVIYEKLSYVYF